MKTLGILVHPGWADNEGERLEFYKNRLSEFEYSVTCLPRVSKSIKTRLVKLFKDELVKFYASGCNQFSSRLTNSIFSKPGTKRYLDIIVNAHIKVNKQRSVAKTISGLAGRLKVSKYQQQVILDKVLTELVEHKDYEFSNILFRGDVTMVDSKKAFIDDLSSYIDSINHAHISYGDIGIVSSNIANVLDAITPKFKFDRIELFGEYANECVNFLNIKLNALGYETIIRHEASVLAVNSPNVQTIENLDKWSEFNYLDRL